MGERVIAVCLDAYDATLSDRLIAAGRLPGLALLKAESARFALEHGPAGLARHTGLTWEQFSSGRRPETSGKWSSISFDPQTFQVRQNYATERPFLADLDAKAVVFDVPYFDLRSAPNAMGAVGWTGHDRGVHPQVAPSGLMGEITAKFGPPPDADTLNEMVYPSVERTRRLATLLRASVRQSGDIAQWLLAKRAPDWDLALVGFGQSHDAIELLYHGIDPHHPLSDLPSAEPAREGLIGVYEEISVQIERLMARFPDVTIVAFTMHGMGANDCDLPTMLLLPELMYRMAFDRPLLTLREEWRSARSPVLEEGEDWNRVVGDAIDHARPAPLGDLPAQLIGKGRRIAARAAKRILGQSLARNLAGVWGRQRRPWVDVDWMPASHYARYWPRMDAFALPSYFDGRIRINLRGREKDGRVPRERYGHCLDRIEKTLRDCVDLKTGAPVVREVRRPPANDPMAVSDTQADLAILWNGSPTGFRHPIYGDIGPGPVRRVGGHSGGHGALYLWSDDIQPGDYGLRSSFDVAPTIVDLMGVARPARIDGESVLGTVRPAKGSSYRAKMR